jgi:hypothetical protein
MLTEEWLQRQSDEIQQEAFAECDRCGGHRNGDCSDQCRYFRAAGHRKEVGEAKLKRKFRRGWMGAREVRE